VLRLCTEERNALLGKSFMVSNLFNQVTTETTHCTYAASTGTPLGRRGTLRILQIRDSYPLFLCLCIYSTYFLNLNVFLHWPHFGFDMLFVLSVLLFALREAFKLPCQKGGCSTRSYSSIFHVFLFFAHSLLLFQKSRQKRFSCSSTQEAAK
jgi:hypothetical protein